MKCQNHLVQAHVAGCTILELFKDQSHCPPDPCCCLCRSGIEAGDIMHSHGGTYLCEQAIMQNAEGISKITSSPSRRAAATQVFLDGGKQLVSSGKDGYIRVWQTESQHCSQSILMHRGEVSSWFPQQYYHCQYLRGHWVFKHQHSACSGYIAANCYLFLTLVASQVSIINFWQPVLFLGPQGTVGPSA